MLFIIHLAEILSYLSTRCSSEPKLGYWERYQWDGDEARELVRTWSLGREQPGKGVGGKGWGAAPVSVSTAVNESAVVVMVFSVPVVLTVLSKKASIKSVSIREEWHPLSRYFINVLISWTVLYHCSYKSIPHRAKKQLLTTLSGF